MAANLILAGLFGPKPDLASSCLRQGHIVGKLEIRQIGRRSRRGDDRKRHRRAAVECFRQGRLVDGVVRGEPHVLVGEALVVAALQQNDAGDRIDLAREIGLVAEPL